MRVGQSGQSLDHDGLVFLDNITSRSISCSTMCYSQIGLWILGHGAPHPGLCLTPYSDSARGPYTVRS